MRPLTIAAIAAALLLAAPAAVAAPTCDNRSGETVKCGTPGAMPVGWAPSRADAIDHPSEPSMNPAQAAALIYILIAFFALLALMPEFDGWQDGDWDEQEGDKRKRR